MSGMLLPSPTGVGLPSCVALVPNDFLARNPENVPVPQKDVRVLVIHVLNQRNTPTEDRHAVATLDATFLLTDGVPVLGTLGRVGRAPLVHNLNP